jgi:hypothetical protein
MDSGERIVLQLRLRGLERDVALSACYTDEDRKLLQAAWKRFDRHKDLFKQVLMSGKSLANKRPNRVPATNPPNDTPGATPQMEMVLIQLPQGGMKISFRKCVAKKSGDAEKSADSGKLRKK